MARINFSKRSAVDKRVRRAVMRGVMKTAYAVHREATNLIKKSPASGRIYRRRGITHQASAPGEPPASDTGGLVGSGEVEPRPEQLKGIVKFTANYARALEYGTQNMEPRPFLRRALAARIDDLPRNVRIELKKI